MNFAAARNWASQQLGEHSDSPQLDAEMLLCHVLGIERVNLYRDPEKTVPPAELARFKTLIVQRRDGYPLAYQIGEKEFWSMTLAISPEVLIPRAETELLVEKALEIIPPAQPWRVLDLGTGSGAIALAIARERPAARLTATDISIGALNLAALNAQAHDITSVEFILSNWCESLATRTYDLIVTNPPYIAAGDPDLAPEVAQFEPATALLAADNGLQAIAALIPGARQHLRERGHLLIEHGWRQHDAVAGLLRANGFGQIKTHRDLAQRPRVTTGVKVLE